MSWLIHEVRRLVTEQEPETILQRMGYQPQDLRALARLKEVVADNQLGLRESGFDFRYDSRGFALALCRALGINELQADSEINELTQACFEDRWAFRPYIFVDTAFRRTSQPLFALAACEAMRRLKLGDGFWRLPLVEQLASVKQRIREHVVTSGGKVGPWGLVQRYLFYYTENQALVFSPEAEIIGEHGQRPGQASFGGIEVFLRQREDAAQDV